jgi:hypothetical protein
MILAKAHIILVKNDVEACFATLHSSFAFFFAPCNNLPSNAFDAFERDSLPKEPFSGFGIPRRAFAWVAPLRGLTGPFIPRFRHRISMFPFAIEAPL